MVRPWNELMSERMRVRRPSPRLSRASLIAASIASAPEFAKNTRPASPAPVMRRRRSASSSWGGEAK